jgi:hypothetical protein
MLHNTHGKASADGVSRFFVLKAGGKTSAGRYRQLKLLPFTPSRFFAGEGGGGAGLSSNLKIFFADIDRLESALEHNAVVTSLPYPFCQALFVFLEKYESTGC